MKESDISGGQTYCDTSSIFSGDHDPQPPKIYAPYQHTLIYLQQQQQKLSICRIYFCGEY